MHYVFILLNKVRGKKLNEQKSREHRKNTLDTNATTMNELNSGW